MSLQPDSQAEFIDFDSAEIFVKQARAAHAEGDKSKLVASIRLVGLALGIIDGPRGMFNTQHLKA